MPEPLLPNSAALGVADPMVVMGKVASAHGIRGWIKVQPFTEYLDSLLDYTVWWVGREQGPWRKVDVLQHEVHAKTLAALLADCPDRNAAERLKGLLIAVPRSSLPQQSDDEYYWADLIGSSVFDVAGNLLGQVGKLLETGANDVLCVQGPAGELLIPFVKAVIKEVDLKNKTIRVDWSADYLT